MIKLEYRSSTGQIIGFAYGDVFNDHRQPGCEWLDAEEPVLGDDFYIESGEIVARPEQSTTISGLILTGLPVPATLRIDDAEYEVTSDSVNLDLPMSGTYRLRVAAFPYKDWTGEITT